MATKADQPIGNVTNMRAQQGMFRAFTGLMRNALMGRLTSFDGKRNYNDIFGWDAIITPESMAYMYNRGGIAKRVVDAFPDAIWARPPQIWAEGDDAWTRAWEDFIKDRNIWSMLHKLDRLSGLGQYAVMLFGTDKPSLERPLTGNARELNFLQPYGQVSAKIDRWDTNPSSPTFGRPVLYRIYPESPELNNSSLIGARQATPTRSSFLVHHSRILHVARGTLENDIFGTPLMAPCWDYLTDLRKVVGSSSESYWIMANRGLQANIDKDMALGVEDAAALQDEIEEFYNGFRRFIRTKGVQMTPLTNDVAEPTAPFNVLVTLISGTTGIPKRILLGSEAGQLASTQDKGNWAERLEEDMGLHVEPHVVKPFIRQLIGIGLLPKMAEGAKLRILWPDAYRMSPLERGQTQAQTARSLANIVKMLESEDSDVKMLLSREELRALLGFASDNRILKDDPKP